MKKILLKWKEERKYKKYLSNKITLNKKIISITISIFLNSMVWILLWAIVKINPNKNAIEYYYMLPIALGAGIAFTILNKIIGLIKDQIKIYDNKIFYSSKAVGKNIKYKNIAAYSILTINEDNNIFKLLLLKYNKKMENNEKYIVMEINENIDINTLNSIFANNNIRLDNQLNESEYIRRKVLRYFNTSNIA